MQLMYVDESGDPGSSKFSSEYFILSGLIISDQDWKDCLMRLKAFRQDLKKTTGLLITAELHAAELVRVKKIEAYRKIRKPVRIAIINQFVKEIPIIFSNATIINICLEKSQFPSDTKFQELAWARLIQRYDTYLKKQAKDIGIIVSDETDGAIIRKLLRRMRVYNPVPSYYTGSHNVPTDNIIEDVFTRSSQHSLFIQAVDFVAHSLYRKEFPKGSYRKYGLEKAFDNLEPILLKAASKGDPLGIVRK